MMYLSYLLIDTGVNPDRPRPGRVWLGDIYRVHQRLSMAFPDKYKKDEDPHFLEPYNKDNFIKEKFLFRVDNLITDNSSRTVIIVQSGIEPDWNYAFKNTHFLAAYPLVKQFNPIFKKDNKMRFRILLNLSKKSAKYRNGKQGKRIALSLPITEQAINSRENSYIFEWFKQKINGKGFDVQKLELLYTGWKHGKKKEFSKNDITEYKIKLRVGLFEGVLEVNDADKMLNTIQKGIASAKVFGCGLLTVANL